MGAQAILWKLPMLEIGTVVSLLIFAWRYMLFFVPAASKPYMRGGTCFVLWSLFGSFVDFEHNFKWEWGR
ncbi:hypothetical protein [Paenibacillus sp. HW567]|uniref:hypothetical protein n=1 Tax=Paenibacillus sp. HW567 TaxID=1034769 RepID=UPI000372F017|nr:hypothetical protein [Paenibacillus sp. HW567]